MGAPDHAPAVVADGLCKTFKLYTRQSGRLLEWVSGGRVKRHDDYEVLRDVSFEVLPGECVGIIGRNGCGKSTLLRILSGALTPTGGRSSVRGRVFALIELSTGFNPLLSGRDNIDFSCQMLGIEREYIRERRDDIIRFAELGRYIDRPLREYSSGMRARLSFSMFAFLEPDVLMIDEAFSVGDESFQKKSYALLERMITDENRSVIFVSHAMATIRRLCQRAVWLDSGRVRMVDDANSVTRAYLDHVRTPAPPKPTPRSRAAQAPAPSEHEKARGMRVGAPFEPPAHTLDALETPPGDPALLATWVLDAAGDHAPAVPARQAFSIGAALRFEREPGAIDVELRVRDRAGALIAHTASRRTPGEEPLPGAGSTVSISWPWRPIGLNPGRYSLSLLVRRVGGDTLLDAPRAGVFEVEGAAIGESVYDALLPPGFVEHVDDQ